MVSKSTNALQLVVAERTHLYLAILFEFIFESVIHLGKLRSIGTFQTLDSRNIRSAQDDRSIHAPQFHGYSHIHFQIWETIAKAWFDIIFSLNSSSAEGFISPRYIRSVRQAELVITIVKKIEAELEYPGQIKVNVIREVRAVDYAK